MTYHFMKFVQDRLSRIGLPDLAWRSPVFHLRPGAQRELMAISDEGSFEEVVRRHDIPESEIKRLEHIIGGDVWLYLSWAVGIAGLSSLGDWRFIVGLFPIIPVLVRNAFWHFQLRKRSLHQFEAFRSQPREWLPAIRTVNTKLVLPLLIFAALLAQYLRGW